MPSGNQTGGQVGQGNESVLKRKTRLCGGSLAQISTMGEFVP
jgi:hypothetical protein